ncbi:MAG: hypothetical protein KJ064_16125 [Anaerolineae bacterium]|nr:hypothetical protein [Anaerolineae bacterium]
MAKYFWVFLVLLTLFSAHAQPDPLLPQNVVLTRDSTREAFDFEAEAGSLWSFTAVSAPFEVVDPVLRLYDSEGGILLENDNEDYRSTNARLEAWTPPADGTYRIEVALEGGERAPTAGTVTLTAIPGYSEVVFSAESLAADTVVLNRSSPAAMVFSVEDFNDGFELRSDGWQMAFTPAEWRLQVNRPGVLSPVFVEAVDFGEGEYRLLIQPDGIQVFFNGTQVVDFREAVVLGSVTFTGTAVLGQVVVTTPFYEGGFTGLPPAPPAERLYAPAFNPLAVMAELTSLGYEVESGGLTMRVPRGLIETSNTGFSLYPLSTGGAVQNFVLSFEGRIVVSGVGAACGMAFRQVDSENFATALFSEDGNLYLLQYEGGELATTSLAVNSVWVDPSGNGVNWVVLVAQETRMTIFVNGRLAGRGDLRIQPGGMSLSVYVNESAYTFCTLDNIWLWELES